MHLPFLILALTVTPIPVKQLGCPPAELEQGWMTEPDPQMLGARSGHAVIPVQFTSGTTISLEIPKDSPILKLLPVGLGAETWSITAIAPNGTRHIGEDAHSKLIHGTLASGLEEPARRLDIRDPAAGTWQVELSTTEGPADGYLYYSDGTDLLLRTWLQDASTITGRPIDIGIGLADQAGFHLPGPEANALIQSRGSEMLSLEASLVDPDDVMHSLPVLNANTSFVPTQSGLHRLIIDAIVRVSSGSQLRRTSTLLVMVEDSPPRILDGVQVQPLDDHRLAIEIPVEHAGHRSRILAGAEVWAPGPDGLRSCCWIGGITALAGNSIELILDTRWLAQAGAIGSNVELRAVRLADVDSFVPLANTYTIELPDFKVSTTAITTADQRTMRQGVGDRFVPMTMSTPTPPRAATGSHALMLCHGYCSDGQSWPTNQFSGEVALYYNPEQNFTHDEFAQDIWNYGSNFKSYSVTGHSQGGNAGLHLYSFYWSGIDWSEGERKVLALGVPFQGTILAGSIADLGEIFGIQCGANYDMTYDGAAQWISWLPGWAREGTWAWSTTFEDGWFWDYCHLASDLVLLDPEDGVVEVWAAHLDGTNDMGTREGWCHIENMADPAQVLDTVRNAEIDAEAAR